jgi:diguanylate cyclase (GGDEF)-like protein
MSSMSPESCGCYRHKLALLFLDLDSFKHINESLGHAIGDKLLKAMGERLLAAVRKSDTVNCLGGDEFVVVLSSIERSEDAALLCNKKQSPQQLHHTQSTCTISMSASALVSASTPMTVLMRRL